MTSLTALLDIVPALLGADAAGTVAAAASTGNGLGFLGYGLAAGLATLGAGLGISKLAAASVESMARQPEASGDIRGAMILTAAFIEGVCLFAVVCSMLAVLNLK